MDIGYNKVNGLWLGEQKVVSLDKGYSRIYSASEEIINIEDLYTIVQIGDQLWTAENLHHFAGNGIELNKNVSYYNKSESSYGSYGLLYSFYAAVETAKHLSKGWRLPSVEDVNKLVNFVGGGYNLTTRDILCSKTKWNVRNGTDNYGLSLIPAGRVDYNTFAYNYMGLNFNAWCSDVIDEENSYSWRCDYRGMGEPTDYNKLLGFSIRLVKDA